MLAKRRLGFLKSCAFGHYIKLLMFGQRDPKGSEGLGNHGESAASWYGQAVVPPWPQSKAESRRHISALKKAPASVVISTGTHPRCKQLPNAWSMAATSNHEAQTRPLIFLKASKMRQQNSVRTCQNKLYTVIYMNPPCHNDDAMMIPSDQGPSIFITCQS